MRRLNLLRKLGHHVPFKAGNIVCCTRSLCCRVADGGTPLTVRCWEGWIDWMEYVMVQGVVDSNPIAIRRSDCNLLQGNYFVGGDRVYSPVPKGMTKFFSGLLPGCLVNRVSGGNSLSMRLYDLLDERNVRIRGKASLQHVSLHAASYTACARSGTEQSHECNSHPR